MPESFDPDYVRSIILTLKTTQYVKRSMDKETRGLTVNNKTAESGKVVGCPLESNTYTYVCTPFEPNGSQ